VDTIAIASSKQVTLFAPEDGFVSFFNSPYYAHSSMKGVDIYSRSRIFGSPVPSPVKGKVRKLHPFKPPSSSWFKTPETEYLMLIECSENPDVWVKILHVDPQVREGDHVEVGEAIGSFLRDGFFHPWTNPHIHVEVRNPTNPIRATGGYPLSPSGISDDQILYGSDGSCKTFEGVVVETGERYVIVDLEKAPFINIGPFFGVQAEVGGCKGILDGGVPHYQRAGLIGIEAEKSDVRRLVQALGARIGQLHHCLSYKVSIFLCNNLEVTLNDVSCIGFSCYLSLKRGQSIKVVLPKDTVFRVGQKISLTPKSSEKPLNGPFKEAFSN
jgi:hypothetical protein